MIDERHPLYHLALVQLALPGFAYERAGEPSSAVSGAEAPVLVPDPAPVPRRPMRDERAI